MEEFAEYMFLGNPSHKQINLSLEGIENNKDLFLFFIDLFCKGLVMCYGKDKSIDFDILDIDKFEKLKKSMSNAGIIISLDIITLQTYISTKINSNELDLELNDHLLEYYTFKIYKGYLLFQIKFSLKHNV